MLIIVLGLRCFILLDSLLDGGWRDGLGDVFIFWPPKLFAINACDFVSKCFKKRVCLADHR